MVNLLESMHKCCLPSGVPSESPGAYEKSLVHKIFGGRLRSQVKCQQCSYCSNKFDPFLDLSLEIFKADSLHKALANFTAAEWLDGGERQYNCQRCKQKVRALKQLTIHKAPYVLTIHLKRFHAHDPGQKIKKKVQFGCALDLKPFVSGSYDGDVKYSLYGVLVHSGSSTHSGHYYCYVRTSNNMWYTLDDREVHQVSEREVLNQQAYMLFCVRDRKSIVPRKPIDVAKENMKLNVNGKRDSPMSNQVLKEVSNCLVENKSCGQSSLTVETQKNISNVDSSRVPIMKDAMVQHENCHSSARSSIQNKKPVSEPSSKKQKQNGLQEGDNIDNNEISKEVWKESMPSVFVLSNPQTNFAHDTNGTSQADKNNTVIKAVTAARAPQDSSAEVLNVASTIASPVQPKNDSHQVVVSSSSSLCDKAGGIGQESATLCSGKVLDDLTNRSLIKDSRNKKCITKSKEKLLKFQASRMHLGSSFLFMSFLRPQKMNHKRSKHKRSKRRMLGLRTPNKEKVNHYGPSSDGGPSTSGKADACCFESVATIGGHICGLNLKSVSNNLTEDSSKGELRRRIDQNSAVLATAMQGDSTSVCCSVPTQFEARQARGDENGKIDQMHNNSMSMFTRGPEETVVARWDDVELSSSQFLESNNDEILTIGYVGDDWDEEYDKGKRKKLRTSKHSFGGPNLFQARATEKSKSKKAKLHQSCSGNQPLRI